MVRQAATDENVKVPDSEIGVESTLISNDNATLERINVLEVFSGALLENLRKYLTGYDAKHADEKKDHRHGLRLKVDLSRLLPESNYKALEIYAVDMLIGGYAITAEFECKDGKEEKLVGKTVVFEDANGNQENVKNLMKRMMLKLGSSHANELVESHAESSSADKIMDSIAQFLLCVFEKSIVQKDSKTVQDMKSVNKFMDSLGNIREIEAPSSVIISEASVSYIRKNPVQID